MSGPRRAANTAEALTRHFDSHEGGMLHDRAPDAPKDTRQAVGTVIIRAARPESGYLVLSNEVARDSKLSYRARGVLAAVLSRPDNWATSAERLSEEGKEGRDAIRSALTELKEAGYLRRNRVQQLDGTWVTQMVVFDSPTDDGFSGVGFADFQPPMPEKPTVGSPDVGESGVNKKDHQEDHIFDAPRTRRRKAAQTGMPDDWKPNPRHLEYCREHGLAAHLLAARFENWHKSKGNTFADWDRAFWTWLHNQVERYGESRAPQQQGGSWGLAE